MLVDRPDEPDFVKILDFGLAKVGLGPLAADEHARHPSLSRIGAIMGTPAYMAPEQAMSGEVDGRADLYSLGVMLYEMLSGIKPFSGGVLSLISHHLATPPPPLLDRLPVGALPEAGQAVALKLLAKQPEARYADAGALVAAIDAALKSNSDLQAIVSPGGVATGPVAVMPSAVATGPVVMSVPTPSGPLTGPVAVAGPVGAPAGRSGKALGALIGASLLLVLLALGTTVLLRLRRHDKKRPVPVAPIVRVEAALPSHLAPDAQLAPALLAGAGALEPLSRQFPQDARVLRGLVRAYATQHDHAAAARTVGRILALTPEANTEPELGKILSTAALGSLAGLVAAIEVLEGPMGEHGVDLLVDLNNHVQSKPWKTHLTASLAKPAVRAQASPATLLYLDLHAAASCASRHALLPRAKKFGDHRALALLRPLENRQGCGFLNLKDCWPCLRQDWGLRSAIAAIEARPAHPVAATPATVPPAAASPAP